MDKFGIFDLLTKLASNKTATDGIINAVKTVSSNLNNNVSNGGKNLQENNKNTQNNVVKTDHLKKKYSQYAILEVLKKHDSLSKKIDENIKNKKP